MDDSLHSEYENPTTYTSDDTEGTEEISEATRTSHGMTRISEMTSSYPEESEWSEEETRHSKTRTSKSSKGKGKGGKKKKAPKAPKKKKLNRKAVYKSLKQMSKAIDEMKGVQEKFAWEKEKLFFYWDFATNKYLKVDQQLVNWRRKMEAFKLQNQHGYFLEAWRQMNNSRNIRQEALANRRQQYNSWLIRILDEQREQGYRLAKDICDESRETMNTGQKFVTRLVNKRKEFTEDLTRTLEDWRPLMKGTERQLQGHYGKSLQSEMTRLSVEFEKIPADREQRLKDQQVENNRLLKEVLSVYDSLISHNFVEILHLAKDINQLKTQERRIREKRDELLKLYTSMKDRMDFLRERVSSLKRQVHAGRKVRTNLLGVLQEQDCLEFRKDVSLIRTEWVSNEVANVKAKTTELNDQVMSSFFSVKRHLFKNIIRSAGRVKARGMLLKNYVNVIEAQGGSIQDVDCEPYNFKKNEEIENDEDRVKVVLGNFKAYTPEEVQRSFAGCADSFMTAVVFFQRRLDEECLSLDDLEFFIRRQKPLNFPSLVNSTVLRQQSSVKHPFDSSFSYIDNSSLISVTAE